MTGAGHGARLLANVGLALFVEERRQRGADRRHLVCGEKAGENQQAVPAEGLELLVAQLHGAGPTPRSRAARRDAETGPGPPAGGGMGPRPSMRLAPRGLFGGGGRRRAPALGQRNLVRRAVIGAVLHDHEQVVGILHDRDVLGRVAVDQAAGRRG